MSIKLIPLRYARALYETGREHGALEAVMRDIAVLEKIITSTPQIKQFCQRPHIERKSGIDFIKIAFFPYVGEYTQAMLRLIVENERIASLPFIPMAFASLVDKHAGIVMITLETAHEVEEDFIRAITEKMEKRLNKQIRIEKQIVPELLGGFRLFWQNRVLDLSAAGSLKILRSSLKSAAL